MKFPGCPLMMMTFLFLAFFVSEILVKYILRSLITTKGYCEIEVRKLYISCGHVVRDFKSEAKTRLNF